MSPDAEPVRRTGDRPGAAFDALQPDLGVDGVVRVGRRGRQRGRAEVAVLVVVDLENFLFPLAEGEDLGRRFVDRFRRDSLLERGGEYERLDRGAGPVS